MEMVLAKKPTGNLGRSRITIAPDGSVSHEFVRRSLGDAKRDIERSVMEAFAKECLPALGLNPTWRQLDREDDLDFVVNWPSHSIDVDLTELVFPNADGAPPFAASPKMRSMGEVADLVVSRIMAKERHYSGTKAELLIYATHFPFIPPDPVIGLVWHAMQSSNLEALQRVFMLRFFERGPDLRVLFPVPAGGLVGFEPEYYRRQIYVHFDSARTTLQLSGASPSKG